MDITEAQYGLIEHCLPTPRGNVSLSHLRVLNAILYVTEQGCTWRGLPKRFGNWHTIYTRMNRWSKGGVLDRMFAQLPQASIARLTIEAVALDRPAGTVQQEGTGALKETARKPAPSPAPEGPPRFIWLPRMLERSYRVRSHPARPMTRPRGANSYAV